MRKVLHKVKSQWVVLGVMGATVVSLGTANVQEVSAAETESTGIIETIEQTESAADPDEPVTIADEESTIEVAESNLEQGKTSLTVLSSAGTTTPTDEIIAVETKDVTAPVVDISSVSLVKTTVTQGDTINISVNITDDSGIASASITYVSPITGETKTIALYKHEISGLFEGNFTIIDATELGTWNCIQIEASDVNGNSSSLHTSNTNLSGGTFTVNETTAMDVAKSAMGASSVEVAQAPAASEEVTMLAASAIAPTEVQELPVVNLATGGTVSTSVPFENIAYATNTQTGNTAEYARGTSGLQWVQVDLGASYDLREIKLWHYFGDGRIYKDVVAQLSNDATFASGAVTVFNNDKDGSAGLGVGTDSEYSETSAGKTISFDTLTARYARFYSNGSTVNGANHYVEIEVYGVEPQTLPTTNLIPEATFSSSVPFDNLTYAANTKADNTTEYARGTSGLQWIQADLGASYDINEINLWHYFGDGRSYHDVIVQLSDDATFSSGAVTVFNNDTNGSAGLGMGTDSEYSETSAGKKILFDAITARYARFYSNGSTVNGANHYVEVAVYGAEPETAPTVNLAPEGTVSSSVPFDNSSFATDNLTDNTANYARGTSGLQWMQVDLGAAYDLNQINLWHYYGDGRSYRDVVVQLSNDASFANGAVTVFNNDTNGSAGLGVGTDSEYSETSAGKTITFDTVSARYARFYSNGSTVNGANHYVEIQVYGNESTKTESKTETVTENVVRFTTIELLDNTLLTGETQLIQSGYDGYDTVTYEVTYTNGVETNRTETSRETSDVVNEIVRIGTQVVETKTENTTENVVTYTVVEQQDDTIPTGERKVIQKGSNGYDTVAYEVTYTNGLETNRLEMSRQTIQSVDEIVIVGTQVIETKMQTATENVVNSKIVELTDSTLKLGVRKVIQSGRNGYDKVTYQVTFTNGSETNRTEVSRKTITALNEIVLVGTQVVETKTAVITENQVAYMTEEQSDNTLAAGKREIIQSGSNGFDTVTYAITYTNGLETGRVKLDSVTTAAVNEVVRVGTQVIEKKAETVEVTNGTAPETIELTDNTLLAGERMVIQAGEGGYDLVTYEVIYTNGAETQRTEINRETIASVNEFVKVGTKIVATETETVTENIVGYTTAIQEDDTLPTGQTQYALIGVNGFDTVTYEVTYINGLAATRKEINRVTTAPVNETVRIGTQVIELKTEVLTENESAFTTIELADDTIPTGTRVIIQAGSNGHDVVTYEVTYTNGSATNYRELSRETIASVNEIVKVGTQVIETKSEVKNENIIGYTTLVEEDATLSADESVVSQTGANGFDAVTYEVTYINGVETSRIEMSRQTTAPLNQIVKVGTKISVINITVTSEDADSIVLNGSTLQMAASISPDDATATEVTWSVEAGTGTATIDSTGLLTAMSAGTVTVKATANDGSGIVGSQIIEIAVPLAIVGFNGANMDLVIPEIFDGSQVVTNYGYVTDFGYTYYYGANDFNLVGGLEYGNKGIVTSINNSSFAWRQLTSVVIPDSVTNIGNSAFYSNQLSNIVIPEGVTVIGDSAFGNNQLTSVEIPDGVTIIGSMAFGDNQLTNVIIPDSVTTIGASAFGGNQLTSIEIPNGVVIIGNFAFSNNQLSYVDIPESVTAIGDYAFKDNQLIGINIPDSVTTIGAFAFDNNQLISVDIGEGVTRIGDYAFSANQLSGIEIPNSVTTIGAYAFYNNQLISVAMGDGVTSIGDYAFSNNQLSEIELPDSVKSIGTYAFTNNQLISVTMPVGLTNIGGYAFNGNQLISVIIPSTVTKIGDYAFSNNRLTDVVIPLSVTSIGESAFNNNRLTIVDIPKGVTSIGNYAFGNNLLTSVTIPNTVTKIGASVFSSNKLASITIPEGVTSIGEYAFSSNQLTNVVIPKTVKIIGDYAFYANKLKDVVVPIGVTRIEDSAFSANQLTKVAIPNSVTSIGVRAFSNNQLTTIAIPKSVTVIGNDAFSNNQLTSIIIPDSVKIIGSTSFFGNQVSCITLGGGVQIGENVLTNDNKFREAYKIGGAGTYVLSQDGEWIKVETTRGTETTTESMVDYLTIVEEDLTLALDESKIYQAGVVGYDTVTYDVIFRDGAEISRVEVSRQTTAPVKQIIKVGKKVEVANITVTAAGEKSLILNGDTLQMSAAVLPEDANMLSVIWSVENGTGEAIIDRNGLLTSISAGTVTVKATANDGSAVVGSKLIEIAVPVTIIRYSGSDLDLVIPETFDGSLAAASYGYVDGYGYTSYYTYNSFGLVGDLEYGHKGIVTSLSNTIFAWKQLTSVVIPDSVTSIGNTTFYGNQLSNIDLPDNLISIGSDAFGYNQLTNIDIPNNVTTIGNAAFYANKLTNVNISDSVISIGQNAFGNNQLTSIDIPTSVTSIGNAAFNANQLTNVNISDSVVTIGESAFSNNQLTSVDIPNSVISIGDNAFSSNQLTNLEIPNSVTSIGVRAFYNNKLIDVTMQEGLTSIGNYAFGSDYGSNQITSVAIPSTVTNIGEYAFKNNRLTNVVIPNGVISIGKYAFNGNQLTSATIPESVTSIGEYAFNSNQLTKVVIPESVTSIGVSAFSNNQLTNIVIPKSITVIGDNAFSYNQLKSIIIPDSVKSIGSIAFYGNQISCITLGGGVQIGETVLTYDNKFREVYNVGGAGTYILTQNGEWFKVEASIEAETVAENIVDYVTIIEEDLSLAADESKIYQTGVDGYDMVMYEVIYSEGTEIGRVELSRQTTAPVKQIIKVGKKVEVTSITVTAAGEKSLIMNGDTLQMSAAVLPEDANMLSVIWSVENGTGAATIDRNGLLTATGAGTVTVNATANDGSNFVGSKVIEIAVPLTVISYSGSDLDVVIPDIFDGSQAESAYGYIEGRGYTNYYTYNGFGLWGSLENAHKGIVTSVDSLAFAWKQLTSIVIPDSIVNIGNAAFYRNQLSTIDLPDSLISIGDNAFGYNQLTSIDIPNSATSIGNYAFQANHLTELVIPSNVTRLGEGAFYGNQLTSVNIPDSIISIEGNAFSDNQLTSVTIPDSIINIGNSSFSNNQLTSIIIPEGVTTIGDSAFSGNQLMSVIIPTSVTSIGNNAFQSNHLLSVVIPEGVTSIGSYAFYDNQLTIVEIPEGVTSIGSYAFSANPYWYSTNGYGNQLTTVIIPSSVTNIGDNAFSQNKLTNVVIPEGVLTIGSNAFYNNQLTSVVIPMSVTSIGDSAFEYNRLTSVVIPEGVTTIGNRAFYGNQLTSVDIPTSVTSIGSYAFYNNQLTNVTIPEGVSSIGEYAFYANRLTSVDIPDTVTTIENNAFEYNQLTSVEISNGVTSIGTQAFNGNQLTSVVIPEGVTSIGNNAFSNNQLSSVEIPNTVSIIGTSAFLNNRLTEIVIPESVTTIGSYAFQNNQLTSIVIPESVIFIGNGAFSQNQFASIMIGEGVQVGDNLLGTNNNFRTAYTIGGAGSYTGTLDGEWVKVS